MKKLILILIFSIIPALCFAEKEKDEVKYEVTIKIVYNAITATEVEDLIAPILKRHKDSCKTEVVVRKADDVTFYYYDASSATITLESN